MRTIPASLSEPARYILLALSILFPSVAGVAADDDAVLDFRTFIPGVVDAPVYRADGTNRLTGQKYVAQLAAGLTETSLMPVGYPVWFGTNEWAGYCLAGDQSAPVPLVLPFARAGDRVWVRIRAWEPYAQFHIPEDVPPPRFQGESAVFSLVVSNTPTPLSGLQSFSLQPAPLQVSLRGDQLVLRWSAGDGTVYYAVEAASSVGDPGDWRPSGMSPVLEVQRFSNGIGSVWYADWVLTNALSGPATFYRLRLLNP